MNFKQKVEPLTFTGVRGFASDMTNKKWLPTMLSHPHLLLNSLVLISTWLDMHAELAGDSTRTSLIKAETIGMINERLRSPEARLKDATLMVIPRVRCC
ncbi:hypothetical protein GQ44DRAFT_706427 [Phaeosphaeriaceae sp. PMI808]|nr:hypothetical protein GQ44DRAFT_706427 [Phaeosphaeriaceae sp. PMI808]